MTTVANMAIKYFDTLEYVKESRKITDPGQLAEYQVKQFESAIETAVIYIEDKYKNSVSHDDLSHFATKEDLERFATKEDLKRFATKEDLKRFATKEDLERFATKEDLERFATKEDFNLCATKQDLHHLERTINKDMKTLEHSISDIKESIGNIKYEALKFIIGTWASGLIIVTGMIGHGFRWF